MRHSRLALRLCAAVMAAVTLAGCGSEQPEISQAAVDVLDKDVEAIADAARADDATAVGEAIGRLREHVDEQITAGQLSEGRAARILAAATRVAVDVGAPAPTVVISRVPVPVPRTDDGRSKGKAKDEDSDEKDREEEEREDSDEKDREEEEREDEDD
jgi:hypothetical protein